MNLNLPILPLKIIDCLSYQKCLIPKDKFPKNSRPGQWAKCIFFETSLRKRYFSITQIFPRHDLEHICYLDVCVTNYDGEVDRELILEQVLLLESRKEIERADILVFLNTEYFIENSGLLTKPYLLLMAETLLQKYHITRDCFIKDPYLLENGIDFLYIEIENNCDDGIYYIITENTHVDIKNISLTHQIAKPDLVSLDVKPFAEAYEELSDLMKLLCSQRRLQRRQFYMNFNAILVGAVGSGKTCFIEEFLQRHRCNVFCIKIINCLKQYPGETEGELRKVFKAASDFESKFKSYDPTVILLEDLHLLCPQFTSMGCNKSETLNYARISAQLLSLVDELFSSGFNIMCLASTSKPDNLSKLVGRSGRFENEICIPALQENDRINIFKKLFEQSTQNVHLSPTLFETIAKHTQGYVLADLALLVQNTTQMILTKLGESLENVVLDILRKSKPISLKGSDVTAYKTTETFESIGGMSALKNILKVSILSGLKQQESFKRFNLSLPKGVLLYGPPGCAKTTIAKCLATEANMTFIATSAAEVYSPYVGCAEKFIAKIFQTARKNSPCVIFLDEIDSLVGRRSIVSSSNSGDVQIRILSTLLTEMDGIIAPTDSNSNIIVVAATNRPDMVDDALMRPGRFDRLIHVPAPDLISRRSILNLHKHKMPFSKSVDLDYLAIQTENFSGADICNLCNEAALQAFQRDFNCDEILMEDFENILKTSKSSLEQNQIDWYYEFENKFL